VIALQADLCSKLTSLKTGTARHRWLAEHTLYSASLRSFRREWKEPGPEGVVRSIIHWNMERFTHLEAAQTRFNAVALPAVLSFTRPFVSETTG
jgi:hypothetical protein